MSQVCTGLQTRLSLAAPEEDAAVWQATGHCLGWRLDQDRDDATLSEATDEGVQLGRLGAVQRLADVVQGPKTHAAAPPRAALCERALHSLACIYIMTRGWIATDTPGRWDVGEQSGALLCYVPQGLNEGFVDGQR